ncbi:MAG: HAMP domain-containing protein [Myxococcales bacterium]|nr:HAMP domain-containing protein [Myxococcales bacterium]
MIGSLRARLMGSLLLAACAVTGGAWLFGTPLFDGASRAAFEHVVLSAGLVAAVLAMLISECLARWIGQPIHDLREAAEALRRGELDHRIRSSRPDELGALATAIDRMADELVERVDAVRHEEARLRTILDAMVEGVLVTDRDGRIVLTNAALTKLAGEDVVGRPLEGAVRSAALHDGVRRANAGETLEIDFDVTSGGARRTIAAQLAPLHGREGVVAVLHDITQLRRVEKIRRDFVANASHELRTPLTAIRGFAETLVDGVPDEAMRTHFIQTIHFNAQRLHALVEDLLQLSHAESPDSELEIVPIDATALAASVLAGLESRAADKAQELELVIEGRTELALADARALDQVLVNLVDNAIKYTPECGRIELRVRRAAGCVVFEVKDTGPGIPEKHLDRIFERFYRVDKGRSRAQGGTGLGLSIVRHLVARMGGEVSVRSTVGEGTTFVVRLEAAVGSLPPRRIASAPAPLP